MAEEASEMTTTSAGAPLSEGQQDEMRRTYIPRVDIVETENEVLVLADMPGVDEGAIDITLEKSVLTINGYVRQDQGENYQLIYTEYTPGNYQRTFNLAHGVDQENIQATVKHGVLRLTLPKSAEVKARKISVQAE